MKTGLPFGALLFLLPAAAQAEIDDPTVDPGGPDLDAYTEFRLGVMDEGVDLAYGLQLGPATFVVEVAGLVPSPELDLEQLMEGGAPLYQITSGVMLTLGERHALFAALSVPLAPPGIQSDEVIRASFAYAIALDG